MYHLLLGGLAMLPNTYFSFDFVNIPVAMKHRRIYAIASTITMTLYWIVTNLVATTPPILTSYLTIFLGIGCVAYFAPGGQRFQAVLTYVGFMAVQLLMAGVTLVVSNVVPYFPPMTSVSDPEYPFYCLFCTLISIPAMYLLARASRRLLPALHANKAFWPFLTIPISHLMIVNFYMHLLFYGKTMSGLVIGSVLTILVSVMTYVLIVFGYRKLRKLDLKEIKEVHLSQLLQAQINCYRDLQTAGFPAVSNDADTESNPRLCQSPLADAVLNAKSAICREHQIPLHLSLYLPDNLTEEIPILCCMLTNLLDRSISETLQTAQPFRAIDLTAEIRGNLLSASCTNPAEKPASKQEPGQETQCLKLLAQQYSGNFQAEYKRSMSTVTMTVQVPQS